MILAGSLQSHPERQHGWNLLHRPRYVPHLLLEAPADFFSAVAKQMLKQRSGGSIVAISSISALVGGEKQACVVPSTSSPILTCVDRHYTPTKAGVKSLMESCAISLGPHGIRCTYTVSSRIPSLTSFSSQVIQSYQVRSSLPHLPQHALTCFVGTIETAINKDDLADPTKRTYMEGRIPLGRLGAPSDIAGPVVFLLSDMSSYSASPNSPIYTRNSRDIFPK